MCYAAKVIMLRQVMLEDPGHRVQQLTVNVELPADSGSEFGEVLSESVDVSTSVRRNAQLKLWLEAIDTITEYTSEEPMPLPGKTPDDEGRTLRLAQEGYVSIPNFTLGQQFSAEEYHQLVSLRIRKQLRNGKWENVPGWMPILDEYDHDNRKDHTYSTLRMQLKAHLLPTPELWMKGKLLHAYQEALLGDLGFLGDEGNPTHECPPWPSRLAVAEEDMPYDEASENEMASVLGTWKGADDQRSVHSDTMPLIKRPSQVPPHRDWLSYPKLHVSLMGSFMPLTAILSEKVSVEKLELRPIQQGDGLAWAGHLPHCGTRHPGSNKKSFPADKVLLRGFLILRSCYVPPDSTREKERAKMNQLHIKDPRDVGDDYLWPGTEETPTSGIGDNDLRGLEEGEAVTLYPGRVLCLDGTNRTSFGDSGRWLGELLPSYKRGTIGIDLCGQDIALSPTGFVGTLQCTRCIYVVVLARVKKGASLSAISDRHVGIVEVAVCGPTTKAGVPLAVNATCTFPGSSSLLMGDCIFVLTQVRLHPELTTTQAGQVLLQLLNPIQQRARLFNASVVSNLDPEQASLALQHTNVMTALRWNVLSRKEKAVGVYSPAALVRSTEVPGKTVYDYARVAVSGAIVDHLIGLVHSAEFPEGALHGQTHLSALMYQLGEIVQQVQESMFPADRMVRSKLRYQTGQILRGEYTGLGLPEPRVKSVYAYEVLLEGGPVPANVHTVARLHEIPQQAKSGLCVDATFRYFLDGNVPNFESRMTQARESIFHQKGSQESIPLRELTTLVDAFQVPLLVVVDKRTQRFLGLSEGGFLIVPCTKDGQFAAVQPGTPVIPAYLRLPTGTDMGKTAEVKYAMGEQAYFVPVGFATAELSLKPVVTVVKIEFHREDGGPPTYEVEFSNGHVRNTTAAHLEPMVRHVDVFSGAWGQARLHMEPLLVTRLDKSAAPESRSGHCPALADCVCHLLRCGYPCEWAWPDGTSDDEVQLHRQIARDNLTEGIVCGGDRETRRYRRNMMRSDAAFTPLPTSISQRKPPPVQQKVLQHKGPAYPQGFSPPAGMNAQLPTATAGRQVNAQQTNAQRTQSWQQHRTPAPLQVNPLQAGPSHSTSSVPRCALNTRTSPAAASGIAAGAPGKLAVGAAAAEAGASAPPEVFGAMPGDPEPDVPFLVGVLVGFAVSTIQGFAVSMLLPTMLSDYLRTMREPGQLLTSPQLYELLEWVEVPAGDVRDQMVLEQWTELTGLDLSRAGGHIITEATTPVYDAGGDVVGRPAWIAFMRSIAMPEQPQALELFRRLATLRPTVSGRHLAFAVSHLQTVTELDVALQAQLLRVLHAYPQCVSPLPAVCGALLAAPSRIETVREGDFGGQFKVKHGASHQLAQELPRPHHDFRGGALS